MLEKILISSCLAGNNVRYDGGCLSLAPSLEKWLMINFEPVVFCPEVAAGMPTPRTVAEIIGGTGFDVLKGLVSVEEIDGTDVTEDFISGADIALQLCQQHNIKFALLAESSPSCGSSSIHNGEFKGIKIAGRGVTAELLAQNGIQVYSPHTIEQLIQD